jgi:hypothetical protein
VAISESQLEIWAQQGKTGQFTDTYKSIRDNLLDGSAPYPVKDVEIFLQGSYGNDTNVWADSDVDIVLKHNGVFYYDITKMTPKEQEHFTGVFSKNAEYGYTKFKADAEAWITRLYTACRSERRRSLCQAETTAGTRISSSASSSAATTRTTLASTTTTTKASPSIRAANASRTSRSSTPRTAPRKIKRQTATSSPWCGSSRTCGTR